MHFIFLGPPGAGKGTQAKIISKEFKIAHLSTGEILRSMSLKETKTGKTLRNIISQGLLVSDDLITGVVEERILFEDCINGFVLDGFPRTLRQAESLETILKKRNISINNVFEMNVKEEILIKRISGRQVCEKCKKIYNKFFDPFPTNGCFDCGGKKITIRADDDEDAFKNVRLKKYNQETKPLVKYYNEKKLLKSLDGDSPPEEISKKIIEIIKNTK